MSVNRKTSRWAIAGVLCASLLAGLGAYTLYVGEGLSYLSKRPEACANCHIMRPHYDGWAKGSHHAVATCVDCHLPQAFFAKYMAKMSNGWHHSRAFTLGNFQEPIRIKSANKAILENNCRRCHNDLTAHMATTPNGALACTHCHSQVGHPSPAGIGGPMTSQERATP